MLTKLQRSPQLERTQASRALRMVLATTATRCSIFTNPASVVVGRSLSSRSILYNALLLGYITALEASARNRLRFFVQPDRRHANTAALVCITRRCCRVIWNVDAKGRRGCDCYRQMGQVSCACCQKYNEDNVSGLACCRRE